MKPSRGVREAVRTLVWLAVAAAGVFAARAAALAPEAVEWLYARRLYPGIVALVGAPGRHVAWSLTQLLLPAAALLFLGWLVFGTARSVRRRSLRRGLGAPLRIAAVSALIVWGFQVTWGLNHARPPLARALGLASVEVTPERLARLSRRLAVEVNQAHVRAVESRQFDPPVPASREPAEAGDDAGGRSSGVPLDHPKGPPRRSADEVPSRLRTDALVVSDRLAAAYNQLLPGAARLRCSTPKRPQVLGWVLPRLGISGFYNPYTAEATVAAGLPDPSLVFVLAHEMAHQRGIAGEDEANFLAFLACRESGMAAADYAGALGAYNLAWNALWRADPDSARAVNRSLQAGPQADRRAIRAWWDRRRSRLEPLATRTNDAYLKASGHRLGVASYGEAVRLLLAWEQSGGLDAD